MKTKLPALLRKTLLIVFFLIGYFAGIFAQSNAANAGKEFYISCLKHANGASAVQIKVIVEKTCYITANYNNQHGVYWNNWNNTLVQPGIYTADAIRDNILTIPPLGTGQVTSRTLTLTSTENICVYVIHYYDNGGATCVLPVSTWGTEYRLATGNPFPSWYRSAYAVVASEPNTVVTLHDNSTITLNKNEVYHFSVNGVDMTGMRISATKPVALFSGSEYGDTDCPYLDGASGDTYEQLWSVDKWGKDFFAFPVCTPESLWSRAWGGKLALVANENGTNITVSGGINGGTPLNYSLNAGGKQYICDTMSGLTRIVSDKAIMVFLLLPVASLTTIFPTDQRIQHALVAPFVIHSGVNVFINQHGIDMLVRAEYWDQTVIKHDGVVVSNSLYTVNTNTYFPGLLTV